MASARCTFADVGERSAAVALCELGRRIPAQGLTAGVNDGPMDDPDNDGISNLSGIRARQRAGWVSLQSILPRVGARRRQLGVRV